MLFLLIGIVYLSIQIININTSELKTTTFEFVPYGNNTNSIFLNIQYNGNGLDEVYLDFEIEKNKANKATSSYGIYSSPYLSPKYNSVLLTNYRMNHYKGRNEEYINFDSTLVSFRQSYSGDIFNRYNHEFSNNFIFIFNNYSKEYPEAKINISNINNVNVMNIYPEPDFKNGYMISFYRKEKIDEIFQNGISIYGENKSRKQSNQNWIFFIGLLLGVFISSFIEIFIMQISQNHKKDKQ